MSEVTHIRREVKRPVSTIGNWLIVSGDRVVRTRVYNAEYMRRVIEGSAKENRMSVAEMHRALIAYARHFGDPGGYIVTCQHAILWWRRQKRANQVYRRAA
jgi:hypothetical protein